MSTHLVHIFPSAKPSIIHWVFSKLEKGQETWNNTLHMATYCPTFRVCTPVMQVQYVPKFSWEGLRNVTHLHVCSTSSEGVAVSHSERKCCKKNLNKHIYTTKSSLLHVTAPSPCFMPHLHSWRSLCKSYLMDFSFYFNEIKVGNLLMNWFIREKMFTSCNNNIRPVNHMYYMKFSVNSLWLT